jgi:hypothetical protein
VETKEEEFRYIKNEKFTDSEFRNMILNFSDTSYWFFNRVYGKELTDYKHMDELYPYYIESLKEKIRSFVKELNDKDISSYIDSSFIMKNEEICIGFLHDIFINDIINQRLKEEVPPVSIEESKNKYSSIEGFEVWTINDKKENEQK